MSDTRLLAFLALACTATACVAPVPRLYDGPERPLDQVAHVALLGSVYRVREIDGTRLVREDGRKKGDYTGDFDSAYYVALEPGRHTLVFQLPGTPVRMVGPVAFPWPSVTVEPELHAGLVYEWHSAIAPDAPASRIVWMAPTADPADCIGFFYRFDSFRPGQGVHSRMSLPDRSPLPPDIEPALVLSEPVFRIDESLLALRNGTILPPDE